MVVSIVAMVTSLSATDQTQIESDLVGDCDGGDGGDDGKIDEGGDVRW